jgi:hypothetical protein
MKTARIAAAWAEQMTLVFCVFAPIAFAVSANWFSNAEGVWLMDGEGVWLRAGVAGVSAGLGGAIGWAVACGRLARPAWGRVVISGMLAGLLVHPLYNFLVACISMEPISLGNVFSNSLFTVLVLGVVTLPAGVFAALCCRFFGQLKKSRE